MRFGSKKFKIISLMYVSIIMNKNKNFPITSVARADLEDVGFDTSDVEDATMERLASKMANAYCENSFWIDLEIIAEDLEIPLKDITCRKCGKLGQPCGYNDDDEMCLTCSKERGLI